MLRAEEDHDRGTLTDARRQTILEHINDWVDERLELMTPSMSRFASAEIPARTAVLCVPASGRTDEIIAKLFQAAIIERNLSARIIGPDAAEIVKGDHGSRAIVISAVPPEAVTAARAVCKRMRMGSSDVPMFVGLWKRPLRPRFCEYRNTAPRRAPSRKRKCLAGLGLACVTGAPLVSFAPPGFRGAYSGA
jgi:hypothetical protein